MNFSISGFGRTQADSRNTIPTRNNRAVAPRKSVVQVQFPCFGHSLAYYNDQFDLHQGDRVYVDGKLEGEVGVVTSVAYNFKIKLSDYKRVIAVVDTCVHGQFYIAGAYCITFDPHTLPEAQATLWFRAPSGEDEIYESGNDDTAFRLDDLQEMGAAGSIEERGHNYYMETRVRYLSLNGTKGCGLKCGSEVLPIKATERRSVIADDKMIRISGTKVKVGSGGCTRVGLTKEQIETARKRFKEQNGDKHMSDSAYLIRERSPLLMLHIIETDLDKVESTNREVPPYLFALGVGFPDTGAGIRTANYMVNMVELKNWMDPDEEEDE